MQSYEKFLILYTSGIQARFLLATLFSLDSTRNGFEILEYSSGNWLFLDISFVRFFGGEISRKNFGNLSEEFRKFLG
ncbi:hypothetical protein HMPREF1869_00470 [Bacteroidales bacterium KA00251]|nr:hypothetical protein HMPREF1869_00470 [Bacteroidales bacterium KA00251]